MILNPPPVIRLLRTWLLVSTQIPAPLRAEYLAALFHPVLNPGICYEGFLEFYHRYLSQIPQPIATEAWGINMAVHSIRPSIQKLSNQTKPTP